MQIVEQKVLMYFMVLGKSIITKYKPQIGENIRLREGNYTVSGITTTINLVPVNVPEKIGCVTELVTIEIQLTA